MRNNKLSMLYSGTATRIGLAGFVISDVLAVPARVLVIVRPYAVSPQGLFMYLRSPAIREDIARMACPTVSETKGFVSLEDLRGYEIDSIFVKAMNEAEDQMHELISHYRESRKAEEDMLYEIQKKLLNAWPGD